MDDNSLQLPWYRDSRLVKPPFQLVKCFKVRRAYCTSPSSLATYSFDHYLILEPSWPVLPLRISIPVEPRLFAVSRGVILRPLFQRMAYIHTNVCRTDSHRQRRGVIPGVISLVKRQAKETDSP
jgi:hypothetical protein